jgi:peptidylprolyl isomerase
MDVVDKIGKVKTNSADKPKVPVRIEKAEVLE